MSNIMVVLKEAIRIDAPFTVAEMQKATNLTYIQTANVIGYWVKSGILTTVVDGAYKRVAQYRFTQFPIKRKNILRYIEKYDARKKEEVEDEPNHNVI